MEKEDSSSVTGVNNTLRQSTLPQNLKADIDVSGKRNVGDSVSVFFILLKFNGDHVLP